MYDDEKTRNDRIDTIIKKIWREKRSALLRAQDRVYGQRKRIKKAQVDDELINLLESIKDATDDTALKEAIQIGRASCRERVCSTV